MAIHATAASGFGSAADAYVRGRPDYPDAVSGWLTGVLGLAPGQTVIDLGAGTGKFTPRLLATGATVIAVEPVDAMRARLSADLPGVQALAGTAEAIPPPPPASMRWCAHRPFTGLPVPRRSTRSGALCVPAVCSA